MKKVLITGATGATGGNAIKKLLELKVPARALVHQVDERSKKLSSQGVEIVQGVGKMLATKLAEKGRPVLVANSRSPEGVADSLAASEASLMPSSTPEARLS